MEVHEQAPGHAVVKISGRLSAWSTAACWRQLQEQLRSRSLKVLEVDASQAQLMGGIGAALLRYLAEGGMTSGAKVELRGLSKEAQTILDTFTAEDFRKYNTRAPRHPSVPAEIGAFARGLWQDILQQITFIGAVLRNLGPALARPKRMRWPEVRRLMEQAGVNALPVVSIISVLIGLVTVLEAAHPLAQFGAQIFLADMIGFSSLRDTAPIVTAILLAGRSGSAFAAELGTMKVNQELDALTTMGLEPMRFLVVQRVLAAVLLTPVLTLYSMLMCILGGLLVMRSLGFPPLMIYHQIITRVGLSDVGVGLAKSMLFGLVVGGVSCLRGLQTGKGPSAVGVSTTRSVIACILLIIVTNTLYSSADYFLNS